MGKSWKSKSSVLRTAESEARFCSFVWKNGSCSLYLFQMIVPLMQCRSSHDESICSATVWVKKKNVRIIIELAPNVFNMQYFSCSWSNCNKNDSVCIDVKRSNKKGKHEGCLFLNHMLVQLMCYSFIKMCVSDLKPAGQGPVSCRL